MTRYQVRSLCSGDFEAGCSTRPRGFGAAGDDVLCPHSLRLCTELYGATRFLALADGRPAGYLLCFVRDREAYGTTLGVRTEFQRTRVTPLLLAAFVRMVIEKVDTCWFTVKPDNAPARALHAMLGASEVGSVRDFDGPGDERIVSNVERSSFELLRSKYERLGLIPRQAVAA